MTKLSTVIEELQRQLGNSNGRITGVFSLELAEDILWFLQMLRRREGYDVERPHRYDDPRRERNYENPFSGTGASEEWIRQQQEFHRHWKSAFEDMFQQKKPHEESFQWGTPQNRSSRRRPWHEVLGVRPDATLAQRQKAYRSLAMQYHPDRKGGSNEKMQELNQAKKEAGL